MTDDRVENSQIEQAVTALYEDERLRSNLPDDAAKILLDWGARRVTAVGQRAARSKAGEVDSPFDEEVKRVRRTVREVNDLAGERASLSADELRQRVSSLGGAMRPTSGTRSLEVNDLVVQQGTLTDRAFVQRVLSLLDEGERPPPAVSAAKPMAVAAPQPKDEQRNQRAFGNFSRQLGMMSLAAVIFSLLLCICVVGAIWFVLPQFREAEATPTPRPTSEPSSPAEPLLDRPYELFFTTPSYPENPSNRQGELEELLADFIGTATRSVDMAAYLFDLPAVKEALLEAHDRGILVRVVTDIDTLEDEGDNAALLELADAGIEVVGGNPNAIMHNKFVVVDDEAVWTGSMNLTENDTYRYDNHVIVLEIPDIARNYTVTFEKMWVDETFGASRDPGGTRQRVVVDGIPVENYFSPEDDITDRLYDYLAAADTSIHFMAYAFTTDELGALLVEQAEAGLEVRGVFETVGSDTQFSEYGLLRAEGLDVMQDGNPYLMHHKVFVIDAETVVLGSFNFSVNAETSNDENMLIIQDSELASQMLDEFDRVYEQALSPPNR